MSYKTIETMREVRLFTTQIVVPAVIIGLALYADEDIRGAVKRKLSGIKHKFVKH